MKELKLKIGSQVALSDWMHCEYGSFEDHNESPDHIYAILKRFEGKDSALITEDEALQMLKSLSYWVTTTNQEPSTILSWSFTLKRINKLIKS